MSQILTKETRAVVNSFYQALSNRSLTTLLQLFSEEVDWDIPGSEELAPWLGKRTTRLEVSEFFKLLWQSMEVYQYLMNLWNSYRKV